MVSVVLSTYNGEKYIKQQLDSILAQTYTNFELIVVDDFSTDGTTKIVEEFEQKYTNILLYKGKSNLGYIKNFERGVKLAKGDLIAFSDQDDYWYPNKLAVLINTIGKYDVAYSDSEFVDENLNLLNKNMSTNHNLLTSSNPLNFVVKNCVSGHAMIFKRTLLNDDFKFPALIPHDWWITFLASCNNGVIYVNQALVKYRIHETNIIGGEGHNKVKKVDKIKAYKYRINKFLEIAEGKEKMVLKKISRSYETNSITKRFMRIMIFLPNTLAIFAIPKKSIFKKYFYAFSMFFKVR